MTLLLKPVIIRIDTDEIVFNSSYTWTRSISLNYPLIFMSRHVRRPDVFKFVAPDLGPKWLKRISGVGFLYNFQSSWCQTVWFQINPDVLLDMIWIQNVWKEYQALFIFGPGPRFDHIAHRRAGRSSVLESSCTKRLSLRSGLAYQWRTLVWVQCVW